MSEGICNKLAEAIEEKVIYQNPLLFLKVWDIVMETSYNNQIESASWHYHEEIEFLAIIEGYLGIQNKDKYIVLGPGDVFIFGKSELHRSHKPSAGSLHYVVFQVNLKQHFDRSIIQYLHCFSEQTKSLNELNYIFEQNEVVKHEAYVLITEIFTESKMKMNGYEIAISAAIKKLLLLLVRNDTHNILNYSEQDDIARLKPVLDYVEDHLGEKITVTKACALINLSYHYFIKYFKRIMGISFLDYVNYKRIKQAESLLITSDLSITDVGCEVGIANMSQFYKLFKKENNCLPKEFKQRIQSIELPPLSLRLEVEDS
ncbi:helix-turn-helix domain-containing protein [Bacillus mycoides]|uniref:helix-turn-helix domain-containing protein n=1 Tax=Bacillus mycoides TaxID=1405 RepID=UPI003D03831A